MTSSSALGKSLPIIQRAAPFIAGLLGGPGAATAVVALERIFGTDNVDEIISADPDATLKLRQLDIQLQMAELSDLASARNRELEISKISGGHDWFLVVLSIMIVLGFYLSIAALIFVKVDESSKETIHYLQDTLGAAFVMIISYYFGTSHQGKTK